MLSNRIKRVLVLFVALIVWSIGLVLLNSVCGYIDGKMTLRQSYKIELSTTLFFISGILYAVSLVCYRNK